MHRLSSLKTWALQAVWTVMNGATERRHDEDAFEDAAEVPFALHLPLA